MPTNCRCMQLRDFIAFGYKGFEFWFPGYKHSRLCAQKSTAESHSSLMACRYTCYSCPTTDRSPPLPVTQFQWVMVLSLIGRYHNASHFTSLQHTSSVLYMHSSEVPKPNTSHGVIKSSPCYSDFFHFSTHHGKWNYLPGPPHFSILQAIGRGLQMRLWLGFMKHQADQQCVVAQVGYGVQVWLISISITTGEIKDHRTPSNCGEWLLRTLFRV